VSAFIHCSAEVDASATLGARSKIWHLAQIREHAALGSNCIIGRGAYVGSGVILGNACKIQNYALVYEPAVLEDGVFIGPAAVLTNDRFPRAVNPDLSLKSSTDWDPVGVRIRRGAAIGARAVCIAPVEIGEWAIVGSGAVVTRDVPAHALVVGNPARQIGWVGHSGQRLIQDDHDTTMWHCPSTQMRYRIVDDVVMDLTA